MLKIKKKAVAVIPHKYISSSLFITDFYIYLLEFLKEFYELTVVTPMQFNPESFPEKIIIAISISHWENHLEKISKIEKNKKIIFWHDDMFFKTLEELKLHQKFFERADLIIHTSKTSYELLWPEYLTKSLWIPMFASPYFFKEFNENPIKKCLLTGQTKITHYPLRNFLSRSNNMFLNVKTHPGYTGPNKNYIRENYAKSIHDHFCCATDSGKTYGSLKYKIDGSIRPINIDDYIKEKNINEIKIKNVGQVLLKIFEITACGSLLLTDEFSPEIEFLGFKNKENYIQINKKNALEVIEDCCVNTKKYENIRYSGWLLAKKNTAKEREKILKEFYAKNL